MNGRPWTRTETDFLRRNLKTMSHQEIGDALGRSLLGVRQKAFRIGALKRNAPPPKLKPKLTRHFPEDLREPLLNFIVMVVEGSPRVQKAIRKRWMA